MIHYFKLKAFFMRIYQVMLMNACIYMRFCWYSHKLFFNTDAIFTTIDNQSPDKCVI